MALCNTLNDGSLRIIFKNIIHTSWTILIESKYLSSVENISAISWSRFPITTGAKQNVLLTQWSAKQTGI